MRCTMRRPTTLCMFDARGQSSRLGSTASEVIIEKMTSSSSSSGTDTKPGSAESAMS